MNGEQEQWVVLASAEVSGTTAPRAAREMIREHLAGFVDLWTLNDLLLATSELVSNAVQYTTGLCRVTVWHRRSSRRIRVGVTDTGADEVAVAPHDVDVLAQTGRGLKIVDTLATGWGSKPVDGGKEVWFEMTLPRDASE